MKKLALTVTLLGLWAIKPVHAAEFFCPSGDVDCLIAKINLANGMPGEQHIINLEPGSYTLRTIDNGENGLPVNTSSIRIQGSSDDLPTVIERDLSAPAFRFFEVAVGGELTLAGVTLQRGSSGVGALVNRGITSLQDSIVRDSDAFAVGAITNSGTLRVLRSIISDNLGGPFGGGILNGRGSLLVVENSTIANNVGESGGGIYNEASLIVKNSAIIFNSTDCCGAGGGILNLNFGTAEIINTTIAKNSAGGTFFFAGAGGGVWNSGQISIINSTVRENIAGFPFFGSSNGGGIVNEGGTVRVQNTIVAGNTATTGTGIGPDCFGTITSLGNNLVGDPSGCDINLKPSDLTGEPGLGPLVEIGEDDSPGKAFYPVLAGSVVINRANPAACPKTDQLENPRVGTCDIGAVEFQERMLVYVDVRPRGDANRINPDSTRNINVAIFSVKGFDATTVDPNTVRFGATGIEAVPVHVGRRDVDGDGNRDMVVRFEIPDTGIKCGDTSATITGRISNGVSFIGSSPIKTVQCPKLKVTGR